MDQQKLVNSLISQHRMLQADLGIIGEDLEKIAIKSGEISAILDKFESDLKTHFKLENGTFYPLLLEKMEEKKMDTEKTLKFISDMKDIEKVISEFLEKFNDPEEIKINDESFKKEFPVIITTLNMRIESEEDGVYQTSLYL